MVSSAEMAPAPIALVEPDSRRQRPERCGLDRIAHDGDRLVDLRERGFGPVQLQHELRQGSPRVDALLRVRRRLCGLTQESARLVDFTARYKEPQQCRRQLGVVGEPRDHVAQLILYCIGQFQLRQNRETRVMQAAVVGILCEHCVDLDEAGLVLFVAQRRVDHQRPQQPVIWILLEELGYPFDHLLAGGLVFGFDRLGIGEVQRDRLDARGVRRKLDRTRAMAPGLRPVLGGNGHFGQCDPRLYIVGKLFGDAQILLVGLRHVAVVTKHAREPGSGLAMLGVMFEDVAELHRCAVEITLLDQPHGILEVFLRALLG
jgi:hypothetical protein